MLVIPVLDISHGCVVHARKGVRDDYRAIESLLTAGSEPAQIINAFLSLYPFEIIYIADLDAIRGYGNNNNLIMSLPDQFPATEFWIDAGITSKPALPYQGITGFQSVLGSENKLDYKDITTLLADRPEPVLSLDFSERGLIGNRELLQNPAVWPRQIIVMSMHRVGSSSGPDLNSIQNTCELAPSKNFFAAGGVRNGQDLEDLYKCGVAGVLVATALHDLTITDKIISGFMEKKCPAERGI